MNQEPDKKQEIKPVHAKPQLYAYYFQQLKEIAKEFGYNLLVHGSMNRDLDLIAIAWVDNPKPELEMIHALHKEMTGTIAADGFENQIYLTSKLPGNRTSYVINLNRGGYKTGEDEKGIPTYTPDPQYYIDISVVQTVPL